MIQMVFVFVRCEAIHAVLRLEHTHLPLPCHAMPCHTSPSLDSTPCTPSIHPLNQPNPCPPRQKPPENKPSHETKNTPAHPLSSNPDHIDSSDHRCSNAQPYHLRVRATQTQARAQTRDRNNTSTQGAGSEISASERRGCQSRASPYLHKRVPPYKSRIVRQ